MEENQRMFSAYSFFPCVSLYSGILDPLHPIYTPITLQDLINICNHKHIPFTFCQYKVFPDWH